MFKLIFVMLQITQQTFFSELVGTDRYGHFFVLLLFAYLGAFISLLIHSTNRDKNSERTPFKWDINFLFSDNNKRMLIAAIALFLSVRFFPAIHNIISGGNGANAAEMTVYDAILTGLGIDKILEWLRNKCMIDKK